MKEFRSKLEDIIPAVQLKFPDTAGFKPFSRCFHSDSIAHPAKANCYLLYYLIKKFTKEGDTVLDPMAGTSSTGIIASLLARNALCIDIEQKFVDWSKKNVEFLKRSGRKKGQVRIIQGDARKLSELLKEADVVVTSPPYSQSISKHAGGPPTLKKGFKRGISTDTARSYTELDETVARLREHGRIDNKAGGPYGKSLAHPYSSDEKNIGNLKHGSVDAIVTSPPYSNIAKSKEGAISPHMQGLISKLSGIPVKEFAHNVEKLKEAVKIAQSKIPFQYSESKDNIGNLPLGEVDAVITSPPFADGFKHNPQDKEKRLQRLVEVDKKGVEKGQKWAVTSREALKRRLAMQDDGYGEDEENIGNLPFDAVITSPPYAHDSVVHKNRSGETQVAKEKFGYSDFYSESEDNIGNLKKETYLEAMLKCYGEMWKVLEPSGLAIIVIKPFIRNKQVVDLPYHTWLLLQKVGFKLVKLFKLRLKQESFWRVLYHKKYPKVPKIKHEYIIIAQKTSEEIQ